MSDALNGERRPGEIKTHRTYTGGTVVKLLNECSVDKKGKIKS